MALFKVGSLDDFSVTAKKEAVNENHSLHAISTFAHLEQVSRAVSKDSFKLIESKEERGIGIKSIVLQEGFEGFLRNLWGEGNEVYFVVWTWDLGGNKTYYYPGEDSKFTDVMIPIKVGKLREFISSGIDIFHKRKVQGGMALRIQIWESDLGERLFGKAMCDTIEAIKSSKLNNLLSLISLSSGATSASISLIKDAALELSNIIGMILRYNGDDYVDYFEGYYPADQNWITGKDSYDGNSSIITLNRY